MSLQSKLEKLTENLKKSQSYKQRIEEQLKKISANILQCKLNTADLTQKISDMINEQNDIDSLMVRLKEEQVRQEYKIEKQQLKKNELYKKVSLQKQILNKKQAYHDQLLKKAKTLENSDESFKKIQLDIGDLKIEILQIENQLQLQDQSIHQKNQQLLHINKRRRIKQDELYGLKRKNEKKKEHLNELQKKLSIDNEKQNIDSNTKQTNMMSKVTKINSKKDQISKILANKTSNAQNLIHFLQQFGNQANHIKLLISKEDQIVQQVKLQKTYLQKKKQLQSQAITDDSTKNKLR